MSASTSEKKRYDAVVVGARCAGSPLALRLAERGWDVLLVDRDPPPADTVSTHFVFPNTVARLQQLGALERIQSRHRLNPLLHKTRVLGHEIVGGFTPVDGHDRMYGITRPVLDLALLEAAVDAGAETRFGERITSLLGAGSAEDPVRGVRFENGDEVEARWVFGADGRASTVAGQLGLQKREPLAGDIGFLFAYWRGLPPNEYWHLDVLESSMLTWAPCEDDISILILAEAGEFTRGNAEERQRRFVDGLRDFPESLDPAWLEDGEQASEVRVAPETMLRGFFRDAAGPGWALVGDAGHFKHPSTGQGISDAIEQAIHVADALTEGDGSLDGYELWRNERAAEHYEWSFSFGRTPVPGLTGPLFAGMASDPQAGQDFRDSFSRLTRPKSEVLTEERLARWLAPAPAAH